MADTSDKAGTGEVVSSPKASNDDELVCLN